MAMDWLKRMMSIYQILSGKETGYRHLQKPDAPRGSAAAFQFTLVMRFPVITGYLFGFANAAQGIKFYVMTNHPHVGIGLTGMIDVAVFVAQISGIQCPFVIQLHNGNAFVLSSDAPGFADRNDLTGQFANLATGRNGFTGKKSVAINPAGLHHYLETIHNSES
jgi:hypothetical protein